MGDAIGFRISLRKAILNSSNRPPLRRFQDGHRQLRRIGAARSRSHAREAEPDGANTPGGVGPLVPHAGRGPRPSPALRRYSRAAPVFYGAVVAPGWLGSMGRGGGGGIVAKVDGWRGRPTGDKDKMWR